MWLGFWEEIVFNPDYLSYVGGRVEVYREGWEYPEEYRFLTKNVRAFHWFRNYWEGRRVKQKEVAFVLWCIRKYFS
jgi:hypothetical protein